MTIGSCAGYNRSYYTTASRGRTLCAGDLGKDYGMGDAFLTSTAPSAAFGMCDMMDAPIAMYLNDVFTVPASLAGLPGISIPAGLSSEGLPLGLQLLGKAFDEETVFRVAGVLEEAAAFEATPAFRAA